MAQVPGAVIEALEGYHKESWAQAAARAILATAEVHELGARQRRQLRAIATGKRLT